MKVVTLKAQLREPGGSSEARRVRHAGQTPGVVYGEGGSPHHITVDAKSFRHAVENGARVIDLEFETEGATRVLLKDLQYDALGAKLLHADFLRLSPNSEIELGVPVELFGTPKGVQQGGVLTVQSSTVAVRCLPRNIPENITVDATEIGMGDSLKAGDLALPENVALAADPGQILLTVAVPRGLKGQGADEEGEGAEGEAAEGAEGAEGGGDDAGDAESGE
jgi:large subunit ribosomal protein L25